MRKVFSTDDVPVGRRFRACQEWNRETFGRSEMRQVVDRPFTTRVMSAEVGSLTLHNLETSPVEIQVPQRYRSRSGNQETVAVNILKRGIGHNEQQEHRCVLRPGDVYLADNRFDRQCGYQADSEFLAVMVSRDRLERVAGPSSLFAGIVVDSRLPSTSLMRSFFCNLLRVQDGLSADGAEQMARVGIDLIAAVFAQQMGKHPGRAAKGSVIVQRAKAYVEANYSDPALDTPRLAAAVAVSIRRLQYLFGECGLHVSDWIWERRLERAAQRLVDPGCAEQPIGSVALSCGFVSQAHFSRRFRSRYGVSPGEHRSLSRDRLRGGTDGPVGH